MLETQFIEGAEPRTGRLMVVLHGLGDSVAGYQWLPGALGLPWLNYVLVNAPDEYYGGYSWFDFAGDARPGIERSRALLVELLDHQRQEGWASEQTVLFGFSQGCLMTLETGLTYPRRLAGLIGISGYVDQPAQLVRRLSPVARAQRLLITHGTRDPLLPFAAVQEQVAYLKQAGLQIEWHEFEKEHTIAGAEELDVIRAFVTACFPQP